jgi:endothelin-converting enzyme
MSIGNVNELIRRIPLFRIIEALAPSGYEIHFVNIQSPDYLVALEEVLSSTPREILQAYFVHRTVDTLYVGAGFDHTRFSASRRMWSTSGKVSLS